MNQRLVVASSNSGKLRELRALLSGLPFELESQAALGIDPVAETGTTFIANAVLKARHAARAAGCAALADDSGLEVDALHGAPGVFSARYAGPRADDAANNAKLIAALTTVPMNLRTARYRCALVFVRAANDPAPLIAEGVWQGMIVDAARGQGGFGYDPYFYLPNFERTAAELSEEEKNRVSHRGIALRSLGAQLRALDVSRGAAR